MCYGLPAKSLEQAKQRLTPEQWARFEREFDDFCVMQGLYPYRPETSDSSANAQQKNAHAWAKWAFFQGRGYSDRTADQRVADAKYTRLAIAMMSDEQAQMSLERWMEVAK